MKNNRKTYLIPTITIVEVRQRIALLGQSAESYGNATRTGYGKAKQDDWE